MRSFQVCTCGQPLQLNTQPTPKPTGSEVLLKVLAAGVCHSDLHLSDGYFDLGGGKKLSVVDRGMKLPVTLGHENVGEVVAVGPGQGRQGRRPAAGRSLDGLRRMRRLQARRRAALHQAAQPRRVQPGGYSDYLMVPHPRYLFDIGDIPPEKAAPLACSGVTTYSALKKVGPTLTTEPTVIIGAGGLGLMCIALHKAMGGHSAIVVDIDPGKREAALKAGAKAVIDGAAPDAAAQIIAATNGGAWAVIDLVGSSTHRAARHRQPDQGRQADHRRALWRRHHGFAAAVPDAGHHGAGLLHRQPHRDRRIDRAGEAAPACRRCRSRPVRWTT